MTVTTTEPTVDTTPAAKPTPAKKAAAKKAPAKAPDPAPAKTTATPKPVADQKADAARADDTKLALHTREVEVQRLLDAGWSRAALTREPELASSTIMWRIDRLTGPDVARLDSLLARIDRDGVQPPARMSTGGGTRTAGPSRAVLIARVASAESRLDAATSAKTVRELREAIAAALELLRGDQPQGQGD